MKKLTLLAAVAALCTAPAFAQTADSNATGQAASDAGAFAATGAITFQAAEQADRIATTPPVYIAPSMFGGANNCGMSDTAGITATGFGIGGSRARESDACNARQDTATAFNLGFKDVAALRFFCFGEKENRQAFEAAGYECPAAKAQTVAGYEGNDPIVRARLGGGR